MAGEDLTALAGIISALIAGGILLVILYALVALNKSRIRVLETYDNTETVALYQWLKNKKGINLVEELEKIEIQSKRPFQKELEKELIKDFFNKKEK